MYTSEIKFEEDFIKSLQENGWTDGVLKNPTEKDLIDNWAKILFENNKKISLDIEIQETELKFRYQQEM